MAINTNAALQVNLSWSQADIEVNSDTNTITDEGYYIYNKTWASGTDNTQINQLWHETRNLTSGASQTYNMTGLVRSIFSGNFTQSFSNIRSIFIENLSSGTQTGVSGVTVYNNSNIAVRATGANGFSGLFNGQSGNYLIPARTPFILGNYNTGIPVLAGQTQLTVCDVGCGSGSSYRIGIFGLS